jgi:hypothetical protein
MRLGDLRLKGFGHFVIVLQLLLDTLDLAGDLVPLPFGGAQVRRIFDLEFDFVERN